MTTSDRIRELSEWIDTDPANIDRNPEALTWHRVSKVAEEAGEVVQAMIGATGGNPRKHYSHSYEDVQKELFDTALAALCAVEHLTNNRGDALSLFFEFVTTIYKRANFP